MEDKEKESFLQYLYLKLDKEYTESKRSLLLQDRESIYSNAYRIDLMINICEILLEGLAEFEEEELQAIFHYETILGRFYEVWMKVEDSYAEELSNFIKEVVHRDKNSERMAV